MERDFELIRKILLAVEQAPPQQISPLTISFNGEYEQAVVNEHVYLLIQRGLLEGKSSNMGASINAIVVFRLTWEGRDFIKVAKEEPLWKKAFSTVKERGGAMTFDILKSLLAKYAELQVGL